MTSFLVVVDAAAGASDPALVRRLLAREGAEADAVSLHADGAMTMGVVRHPEGDPRATVRVVVTPQCAVVADATLYYGADLRRALRAAGAEPSADDAASLVAAAFAAWGDACVERLEGDFAFALWDRRAQRLVAARDIAGRRPLFVGTARGAVVVGSSIALVAAHPAIDRTLDLGAVAADAAGLFFAIGTETCWCAIQAVGAGHRLRWRAGAAPAVERYWHPTPDPTVAALRFDDAAAALRELLVAAARERVDADATTAVWMSGGRDSTAAFAAAQQGCPPGGRSVFPISRGYPQGDSGNEDRFVEAVAAHWRTTPRWIDTRPLRMFDGAVRRAVTRAEAYAQPFETLTRALAQGTRDAGARVALDGHGGDFLFQVSPVYLADLVRAGRLRGAVRDWRAMNAVLDQGWRGLVHWGVNPFVPAAARSMIEVLRGRRLLAHGERPVPSWIAPRFAADHALAERARAGSPDHWADGPHAMRELHWYLTHPFFARVNGIMGRLALDHGVEIRSPLYDRRVIAFALGRPRVERNDAGDKKRLLRHAMRGLLPESVLAPRRGKTGTQASFFIRGMRAEGLPMLAALCRDPILAELGIVDRDVLTRVVEDHHAGRTFDQLEPLSTTLQAELWLRARENRLPAELSDGAASPSAARAPVPLPAAPQQLSLHA